MYEGPIQDLIDELSRLPGIGPKSAQRLAFYIVKAPAEDARRLAEALVGAKEKVRFCRECFSVAEGDLCRICRDPGRDSTVICVVEEPKDQAAIEKAGKTQQVIIVGFDGQPVAGIDDLHRLLVSERIGARTTIVVLRTADKLELAIVPTESATPTA